MCLCKSASCVPSTSPLAPPSLHFHPCQEQGLAKLEEIYQAVVDACPFKVIAIRSAFAVTLVSQYPFRHVQIVTRLYNSPAEVLMGFDVDSCAVRCGARLCHWNGAWLWYWNGARLCCWNGACMCH